MQLKQLSYFISVVESGSFNKAAEGLFITQSTLSQSIHALEEELGFSLLVRSRTGVKTTEMGDIVYKDSKKLLRSIESQVKSWRSMNDAHNAVEGLIKIGVVPGKHTILMNMIVNPLKAIYPNLKFKIMEARSPKLPKYLINGQVDLILGDIIDDNENTYLGYFEGRDVCITRMFKDHYMIGVNSNTELAKQDTLTPENAKDISLACYVGGDEAARVYFKYAFDPDLSLEYTSFEKMVRLPLEGEGVSVLPELAVKNSLVITGENVAKIRFMDVNGFRLGFTNFYGYLRENSDRPELSIVTKRIDEVFANLPYRS